MRLYYFRISELERIVSNQENIAPDGANPVAGKKDVQIYNKKLPPIFNIR